MSLTLRSVSHTAIQQPSELLAKSTSFVSTLPGRLTTPEPLPDAPSLRWSQVKSVSSGGAETKLYKTTHLNEPWFARVTLADDLNYDVLHRGLLEDRIGTDQAYLYGPNDSAERVSSTVVQVDGGNAKVEEVKKYIHLPAFSPREFREHIISRDLLEDADGNRGFMVVSLPAKGEVEQGRVRGAYVAVEIITEVFLDETKTKKGLEVIMACSSDAGGSIPRWVQNMAFPGQTLSDVEKFFEWTRKQ